MRNNRQLPDSSDTNGRMSSGQTAVKTWHVSRVHTHANDNDNNNNNDYSSSSGDCW